MKWRTDLPQRFGFTENEIRVILFLGLSLVAGTVIQWFRSGDTPAGGDHPAFDYSRADSEFIARSRFPPPENLRTGSKESPPRTAPRHSPLLAASININSATKEQLTLLPGIGEAFAERIILFREEHGPFASVDGLRAVRGIGPATMAKIRPFVTVVTPH